MSAVVLALDLILALLQNAGKVSAIIAQRKAAGQSTISVDDLVKLVADDDAARAALVDAIAKAKDAGF
jgi:hypothetical protein